MIRHLWGSIYQEEAGYGAALRAAGARDALVAMADAGVLPPDVALEDADAAARSDGLAEFAIGDDDVADAWRRAARAHGNVKNCTVLTREDEYCLECPLGSMCDAWTTAQARASSPTHSSWHDPSA